MGPIYIDGAVGDGFVLCVKCANKRDEDWQAVGSGLTPLYSTDGWDSDEGGLYCDDCGEAIYEAEPEPEPEEEDGQEDDSDDPTSVFWKPGEETLALARWVNGGPLPGERPLTHAEQSKRANNATPCTAADITFGGKCLACGWEPR